MSARRTRRRPAAEVKRAPLNEGPWRRNLERFVPARRRRRREPRIRAGAQPLLITASSRAMQRRGRGLHARREGPDDLVERVRLAQNRGAVARARRGRRRASHRCRGPRADHAVAGRVPRCGGFTRRRSTETTAPRSTISARPRPRSETERTARRRASVAPIRSQWHLGDARSRSRTPRPKTPPAGRHGRGKLGVQQGFHAGLPPLRRRGPEVAVERGTRSPRPSLNSVLRRGHGALEPCHAPSTRPTRPPSPRPPPQTPCRGCPVFSHNRRPDLTMIKEANIDMTEVLAAVLDEVARSPPHRAASSHNASSSNIESMRSSAFSNVFRMDTASSASTWKAPLDRTASTYIDISYTIYTIYKYTSSKSLPNFSNKHSWS